MPNNFKKLRKQIAEAELYDDLSTKALGNLREADDVTRFSLEPNSQIMNDYDTSDAYKKLRQVRDSISGPDAPARYAQHRKLLREANKSVLPELLNRAQMMNTLALDDDVQKKAIANDLINKRVSTGKLYDFPEIQNNPSIRHSENDFIDRIARKEAAKKMEQEGVSKVLSSYLDAKKGALGTLKTAGKLGLKAIPVVGALADIAMTSEAGQGSDIPLGPQLTSEEIKKLIKK
jgi:hypothetical protein